MKPRLYVLVIGLTTGFAIKWGVPTLPPQAESAARSTQPAGQTAAADPLVPPLQVPGMLPPLSEPHPVKLGLFNPLSIVNPFGHDPRAAFHAHGQQICASGCAASRHPTEELTEARFHELIARYADEPVSEESLALETLLYFGRQTREMLARVETLPLDPRRARVLARELAITHARIAIRVVDQDGEIRTWLPPTSIPFDRRHVFDMETHNVQPLVTSGTVKRVGLYHLWTRL
ncbi:MAG: hypothetical protein OES79_13015 [Planctomycetota bacterium]|nr:hypothetical protein [Planctomycetota bacterium]